MEKQIAALATDDGRMVMWDIDRVLADYRNAPWEEVAAERLIPQEWLMIDREYARKTDVSKPVIVFALPEGLLYIADGNHRVYRAAVEKIATMKVICLSEQEHLQYLFRSSEDDYQHVTGGLRDAGIFIAPLKE